RSAASAPAASPAVGGPSAGFSSVRPPAVRARDRPRHPQPASAPSTSAPRIANATSKRRWPLDRWRLEIPSVKHSIALRGRVIKTRSDRPLQIAIDGREPLFAECNYGNPDTAVFPERSVRSATCTLVQRAGQQVARAVGRFTYLGSD